MMISVRDEEKRTCDADRIAYVTYSGSSRVSPGWPEGVLGRLAVSAATADATKQIALLT